MLVGLANHSETATRAFDCPSPAADATTITTATAAGAGRFRSRLA